MENYGDELDDVELWNLETGNNRDDEWREEEYVASPFPNCGHIAKTTVAVTTTL